jgi:hypothetical protein
LPRRCSRRSASTSVGPGVAVARRRGHRHCDGPPTSRGRCVRDKRSRIPFVWLVTFVVADALVGPLLPRCGGCCAAAGTA